MSRKRWWQTGERSIEGEEKAFASAEPQRRPRFRRGWRGGARSCARRAWLSALFVLPPCWRPARWPATSPPEREEPPESVVGEGARLTDGAVIAALEAPAGVEPARTAEVEGAVEAAFRHGDRVPVIVRLREQADLPAVAARARAAGRALGRTARMDEVVRALRATADCSQASVRGLLRAEEAAGRVSDVRS